MLYVVLRQSLVKGLLSITWKSFALESSRFTCQRLSSQQSKSSTCAVVVVAVMVVRIVVAASSSAGKPSNKINAFSLFTLPQTHCRSEYGPRRNPRCASRKGSGCLAERFHAPKNAFFYPGKPKKLAMIRHFFECCPGRKNIVVLRHGFLSIKYTFY